jgi:hypothetical protein
MNRTDMAFHLTFCGPNLRAIVEDFVARGEPFVGAPAVVRLDAKGKKPTADWLLRWFEKAEVNLMARWGGDEPTPMISLSPGRSCFLEWPGGVQFSEHEVLDLLAPAPFAYGTTASLYAAWLNDARYKGRIIGPDLQTLGWACYFKPPGLARIPSRWFEHGPWLTLKGAGDVTLTTFHDLGADAETALTQAVPCHEWMWWGFAQEDYREFSCELSGHYDAASRTHEIVVGEREFTDWYPFEASIARFEQRFPHGKPVEQVAFVFKSTKQAEQHLHRLWLYEMQCWTMTDGGERKRLDLEYSAKPVKPTWVAELEARLKVE